jgi:hypothetical protein
MELRIFLAVVCTVAFLFCSVSAAGTSLTNTILGGSQDSGLSIPQLPPPAEGSILQRKALDSQPFIYKTSDRLLHEAEISRDAANKKYEECLVRYTKEANELPSVKQKGAHYTIEEIRKSLITSPDLGFYSDTTRDLYFEAMDDYQYANKQYQAALAATDEKDYERQARIFESSSGMYSTVGNTAGQKQVEKAAVAARSRAEAESLPLPMWIVVCGIIGGLFLIQRKRK